MKKIILILFLCVGAFLRSEAQNIYQAWVFLADNDAGQIEFNQKDKKITFRRFDDIQSKTFSDRVIDLEIVETIQEKEAIRFIIKDSSNDGEIGMIYCFDIGQESMHIFALQHARSIEYAKSYEVPKGIGITGRTWASVEKIMQSKNPEQMSKEDALKVLKAFKEKLVKLDLENLSEELGGERELYVLQFFQDIIVENGYNVFTANPKRIFEIYESDEDVKKLMDEIKELVEDEEAIEEEESTEKDDGGR